MALPLEYQLKSIPLIKHTGAAAGARVLLSFPRLACAASLNAEKLRHPLLTGSLSRQDKDLDADQSHIKRCNTLGVNRAPASSRLVSWLVGEGIVSAGKIRPTPQPTANNTEIPKRRQSHNWYHKPNFARYFAP
jgi:hypothetical protein